MDKNQKHSICVCVVFFHPTSSQIAHFEKLSSIIPVIAVDNSNSLNKCNVARYIPLLQNRGIADAQNIGISQAVKDGFDYIVFSDQDSKLDECFVCSITSEYNIIKQSDCSICALGPVVIDERTGIEYKSEIRSNSKGKVNTIISSGMIVESDIFNKIGLMESDLFIDLVDSEWCWRAISRGYSVYMTPNVKLNHSVGNKYLRIGKICFGIAAPFRYYYLYRNSIWMMSRNYVPSIWKIKKIIRGIIDMVIIPIISKNPFVMWKFMLKGIKDGMRQNKSVLNPLMSKDN